MKKNIMMVGVGPHAKRIYFNYFKNHNICPKIIVDLESNEVEIKNYLKINNDEVLAIGDNLNDLDMVKNSGIGVAVANSYDELKSVAKYITENPVETGGFAEAVYKFVKF